MTLLLHIRFAGWLLIALGGLHAFIPRHLRWKDQLSRLAPVNRKIFLVHSFFIALIVTMMGVLSACFSHLLAERSPLARVVLAGLTMFWFIRLVFQWGVYDGSLWKGDRFRTTVHFLLSALWAYLFAVYGAALWVQLHS